MALTWQGWIMSVYLLICWSHTSFCTPPPYQSGSCCRYSLRTRTGRKRWPACHSTSGYYSPDMCPGPKPSHSEGLLVQSLQDKVSHDGKNKVRSRKKILKNTSTPLMALIPPQSSLLSAEAISASLQEGAKNIHAASKIIGLPTPHLHDLITEPVNHKALIISLEPGCHRYRDIQGFSRKTMIKESLDPWLCCKHTGLELQWTSQQIWSGVSDQTLTKPKSHKKWKSWLITCGLLMLWSELLEIYSSEDIISRFPDPVWRRVLPRHRLTDAWDSHEIDSCKMD